MARADLLKRLFASHQKRDEAGFRSAAVELIEDERKKHHLMLANELLRILNNGVRSLDRVEFSGLGLDAVPVDSDRKTALLQVRNPERVLDDLVLGEGVKQAVVRVLRETQNSEILESHGLTPIRRALFCGPPGCGKTATAEAMASELGLPLLYVRFDAVVSSLLGETAANIRKVFDFASRGQWVLFFDEFDAIGRSRDDATEHGEIKRVVNSFLQLLDNFRGRSLVIAATNFEQALDPAIWRRFDDVVKFPKPGVEELRLVFEKRIGGLRFSSALLERVVQELEGGTHADAERMAIDIRKMCALEGIRAPRGVEVEAAIERWQARKEILRAVHHSGAPSIDER